MNPEGLTEIEHGGACRGRWFRVCPTLRRSVVGTGGLLSSCGHERYELGKLALRWSTRLHCSA